MGIATTASLEGVGAADLVIEAATENPELKLKIFNELDRLAQPVRSGDEYPSISITKIAAATKQPEQVSGSF
jgi:3-hydroxybutyryl-CoA dehydrogenase